MLETDIENELVRNVTSLLLELGTGFAFMGQQYHLDVGGKDFYIDLLFYDIKLKCYVAIDLKTGEFKPEQASKMNFYLSALDNLVKAPDDNPSVGFILCRDENRTIAEYALRDMSKSIGVSEYHLCNDLPLDLKNVLPDPEEMEQELIEKSNLCRPSAQIGLGAGRMDLQPMSNEMFTQLQEDLATAYIDGMAAANLDYKPAFVSNKRDTPEEIF